MTEPSPMMKQYLEIKSRNKDSILFFRFGDFYEMFFEDAKLASEELELTLTKRSCGNDEKAPMCGVPYHSSEGYIARLIKKGYKVAICEQLEDPSSTKTIVKRDVVRVITPGTVIDGSFLDESKNNYIAVIEIYGDQIGLTFADVSTGELLTTQYDADQYESAVISQLARFNPSEILLNKAFYKNKALMEFIRTRTSAIISEIPEENPAVENARQRLLTHFGETEFSRAELDNKAAAVISVCHLLDYLSKTQMQGIERINTISYYSDNQYMGLDLNACRNLELVETMRSREMKGSLLWVLDYTRTSMGKRLIRSWIEQPLINRIEIEKRLAAVDYLVNNTPTRIELADQLSGIFDIDRLLTKIIYGSATPRELRSLWYVLTKLPRLKQLLSAAESSLLREIYENIDTLEDICLLIDQAILPEPPLTVREGRIIRDGYSRQVDELRSIQTDGKGYIARIENAERQRTGIKNLRISYNKVFGYYIEITKSNLDNVPDNYIRKQTLTNCERFITQELKELENKIIGAQEKLHNLEYELFNQIREKVGSQLTRIQRTSTAISRLDVLISFATAAVNNNYTRPEVNNSNSIIIKEGRHPVVEKLLTDSLFVPNDAMLDTDRHRLSIITGPNMAGKSTYMRQIALITIMAQIGSFVPALSASIGIVDSIFTRVGASDDLAAGQSTFMVEMKELADILKKSTEKSLIILDEIGRGTSTYDGMSIARAVIEYIADKKAIGAKTLFATHYHELTNMEYEIEGVLNYSTAVKKRGDDITFLRRIVRGAADDSYGVEVALLAGVPKKVISRAKDILKELESDSGSKAKPDPIRNPDRGEWDNDELEQTDLFSYEKDLVIEAIKNIDPETLTPIEALNKLYELKKMIND